ncbi:nuclear transport factor 2 family protein [Rhodococcus marinonascens]|uniref:nuclear transport factor 2 family protein n=1 Tax=Rhodococcus marinonascens TaxID=38311 RepID=UPI000AB41039|nr:nuclear transport factor 2 family protein [Rhodococcus marinonascens]
MPEIHAGLERRITRLEDRARIQDLAAAYAIAVDDHDIDTLVGLFSEDGTFERAGVVSRGHEEIRAFYVQAMDRYSLTLHTPQSNQIAVDGDHAKGLLTGQAELALDGTLVMAAYRYSDAYVRCGGRWLFTSRRLRFLYAVPFRDLETAVTTTDRICWPGTDPRPAEYPETHATWATYR